MELNHNNYFSAEADKEYMSVSQWHLFSKCESKALATILGQEDATYKSAFLEGHMFEACVTGNKELFMAQHPEIISSRGATAGQIKAEFKKVIEAAEKFNAQEFFTNIIKQCEKQVILTGEIEGVKIKCALDLFDKETNSIYDIKCMKDFKEQWSSEDKMYIPWYYAYKYVLQLSVYKEIAQQNFGKIGTVGLLAATKEEFPDLNALCISHELLDMELERFKLNLKRYDEIKKGNIKPISCGSCDYCKKNKVINRFEEVR